MSGADRDLLIEIKTMLQVAIDRIAGLGTRTDSHDQRLQAVERDVAVLKATVASGTDVRVLQSADTREREDRVLRPNIWVILGALATVAALVITIALLTVNRGV